MPDMLRVVVAELMAFIAAAWIGYSTYHFLEPPKGAWWDIPFTITVFLGSLSLGALIGYGIYRASKGKGEGQ